MPNESMKHRHIIAVMAISLSSVISAFAQGPPPSGATCNVDFTVPSGNYSLVEDSIYFIGGQVVQGVRQISGPPVNVTFSPNSLFKNSKFNFINSNISAKDVVLDTVSIQVSGQTQVTLENCYLNKVNFNMTARVPNGFPESSPGDGAKAFRSTVTLRNCVLNSSSFQSLPNAALTNVVILENCTWYSDSSFSFFNYYPDLIRDLKQTETKITNCRLIKVGATVSLAAVTENCYFEESTFVISTESQATYDIMPLTATFSSKDLEKSFKENLPMFKVTLGKKDKIGSTLKCEIVDSGITFPSLPYPAQEKRLSNVIPPLQQKQPQMTGIPSFPGYDAPTSPTKGPVTGTEGATDIGLLSQQSHVHGLLIQSLERGKAGSASRMNATALEIDKSKSSEVLFNQDVGDMMSKSLSEVAKFTQLHHKGWPKGYRIELAFEDKYTDKDGPSAAVACSLLLHSLIIGKELDPAFAVTGDMNADGSVQPIGGVSAKIRGATNGKCKIIAIPLKNEKSLPDLLMTDGPYPFSAIQIYSISQFSDADALASTEKPAALQSSVTTMNAVQELLNRDKSQQTNWLKNQHVIAKLQEALNAAPNNLSAKYLLMFATGKLPQTLSLAGSLDAIESGAAELVSAIKTNKDLQYDSLKRDTVGSSITSLQNTRSKCDPRVRAYADAILRFGTIIKDAQDRPPTSGSRLDTIKSNINSAVQTADSEYKRLLNDPKVMEELDS